jgi:glycosyltransferase involved in cell wall biosynthesis
MALISVGVPTRNRLRTLSRSVESVRRQLHVSVEIIISDNCSTDDTASYCRALAARDPRIRYIRQADNIGAIGNFNCVLKEAVGTFFMWLADDDWLNEMSYLQSCVKHLESTPDCILVGGAPRYFDGDSLVSVRPSINVIDPTPASRVLQYLRNVDDNAIFYGVARRAQLFGMSLSSELAGDWLWVARLAFKGHINTITDIHLNRAIGGVSEHMAPLAATYGLSSFWVANPRLRIARNVFIDVASRSPTYHPLGKVARLRLAYSAYRILCSRFNTSHVQAVRGRLQLRTRASMFVRRALRRL